ncbi:hypothetical protein DQ384_05600 [Sphaerisporangium album]|uniref:Uncharacterized protein n=1 Tax=Sphaerisporangium album TaxID=509200 RepID=A0A367FQX4_9ACTN|nr:hypothetical protein [Sphaerisporangium album]RCG32015.1 hypothetical protein DQ384_05600 [Sphaerisporangium album]
MGEAMKAAEGYIDHGPHVHHLAGRPAERLRWMPYWPHTDRPRVLRWTCECRLVVYYLVVGGGRAWIRREARQSPARTPTISSTGPMRYAGAERLWERLLLGRVR